MKAVILMRLVLILLLVIQVYPCRMLGIIALPGNSLSTRDHNGNLHGFVLSELEALRLQGGSGAWPYSSRDGWALTSYTTGVNAYQAETVRSEVEAYQDETFYEQALSLLDQEDVTILIGHVRQSSSGADNIQNPHPFNYMAEDGKEYSFAHNGDLDKDQLRQLIGDDWLENHPPQTFSNKSWNGEGWSEVIDSELFFFWIMKNIEESASLLDGIMQALAILEDLSPAHIKNFLLSDGDDLYVYRSSPHEDIYYFDADPNAELPWYIEISNQRAIMSTPPSTGPLADILWIELPDKQLLILKADGSTQVAHPQSLADLNQNNHHPQQSELVRTFPNPFNAGITMSGQLMEPNQLRLTIHDMRGKLVYDLGKDVYINGAYQFYWDGKDCNGRNLESGSYFFRILGSGYRSTGKILLLK